MGSTGLGRFWRHPLARRALLAVLGLALVTSAAYVAFRVIPGDGLAEPGQTTRIDEQATTWSREDGATESLRQRTIQLTDGASGLVHHASIDGEASPRGARFQLPVDERLKVEDETGVRASFPPTPIFETPPEAVHLAVPWAVDGDDPVGAVDGFHRMGTVERGGITLLEYHARESSQFFVHEGTIWFRQANRSAIVEPATGIVVDYHDEETLWTRPFYTDPMLGNLQNDLATREKVWEATVEPTPTSQARLLEQALAHRAAQLEAYLTIALPALAAGELLLWAAIVRRPRTVFDGAA